MLDWYRHPMNHSSFVGLYRKKMYPSFSFENCPTRHISTGEDIYSIAYLM